MRGIRKTVALMLAAILLWNGSVPGAGAEEIPETIPEETVTETTVVTEEPTSVTEETTIPTEETTAQTAEMTQLQETEPTEETALPEVCAEDQARSITRFGSRETPLPATAFPCALRTS